MSPNTGLADAGPMLKSKCSELTQLNRGGLLAKESVLNKILRVVFEEI